MINFPKLFGQGAVGSMLRKILAVVPDSTVVPIMQGQLRGKKWVKGAGVNGYWLGTYEIDHQNKIAALLKPGQIFWDVGAHVGYFSLLAAKIVGDSGKVFSFEPFPRNVSFLKKHIALNSLNNVSVVQIAVSDTVGFTSFEESDKSSMGKLSAAGTLTVEVSTIDDLVFVKKLPPPSVMKIDVEGLQDQVLLGGLKTLETYKPTVIVEAVYEPENKTNFSTTLTNLGYVIKPLIEGNTEAAGDFCAIHKSKLQ